MVKWKKFNLVIIREIEEVKIVIMNALNLFMTGTKLQWSSAITLAVFIWMFSAFWSAMPLLGWGEYDYEPLRTCCTLDYSKGDRYCIPSHILSAVLVNKVIIAYAVPHYKQLSSLSCIFLFTETMCPI